MNNEYDVKVADMLHTLGITNTTGYVFLKEAIAMVTESNVKLSITKDIYFNIAKKFKTTPSRVERTIRYCLVTAHITPEIIHNKLGYIVAFRKDVASNGEFIYTMAEILSR